MRPHDLARLLHENGKLTQSQIDECRKKGWLPAPELETDEDAFNFVKDKKIWEISEERYKAECSGVELEGKMFASDRYSQDLITGAALKAMQDSSYVCKWKSMSGWVTLDATQIMSLADSIRSHVQSVFDHEHDLDAQIDSATTIDELNSITW